MFILFVLAWIQRGKVAKGSSLKKHLGFGFCSYLSTVIKFVELFKLNSIENLHWIKSSFQLELFDFKSQPMYSCYSKK